MNTEATSGATNASTGRELRCPYCHAEPGLPCTTSDGYDMASEHAARDATLGPLTRRLLASAGRTPADAQRR